jgi:uncharacterized protein YbjT (DUF2867 family)
LNIPKQFAIFAQENKVKNYLLISSLDANAASSNFLFKDKGEIKFS